METWNSFKNKRTQVELYTEDASIMYVPTAVGVKGNAQIRRFFLNPQFSEKVNSVKETVHHTLHTGNKLIEESNWIITFHTGECTWMVPGVESSYLLNTAVKIPVITSVTFEQDKIASIHYHWDQASVLKQLKLITEKQNLPVTGAEQADIYFNPKAVQLKGLSVEEELNDLKLQDRPSHLNGNRIFGQVNPQDMVNRPVRRAEPNARPSRDIFTYQPPENRPLVKHDKSKLEASFSFAHDEGNASKKTNGTNGIKNAPAGKPTPRVTGSIFF